MIIWHTDKSKLNELFEIDVSSFFAARSTTWIATRGYATLAEQDVLYQKYLNGGPLAAPPGKSAHNFGLAIDVVLLLGEKTNYDYTRPEWEDLFAAIAETPHLHSGIHFNDPDHIERYQWEQHK